MLLWLLKVLMTLSLTLDPALDLVYLSNFRRDILTIEELNFEHFNYCYLVYFGILATSLIFPIFAANFIRRGSGVSDPDDPEG